MDHDIDFGDPAVREIFDLIADRHPIDSWFDDFARTYAPDEL